MLRQVTLGSVAIGLLVLASCGGSNGAAGNGAPGGDADGGGAAGGDGGAGTGTGTGTATCGVSKKGTAGLLVQGTLLAPAGVIQGELLIDATGKITCVDRSCAQSAGYADATVLACPDGVVSPGLINAHDHTEYNTGAPVPHSTTRWSHRSGWRTGAGGEPKLSTPSSSTDPKVVATAELRFVLGGATSVNGSGSVPGLLRNIASRTHTDMEGLTGPNAYFDTFPLGDSNGTLLTSGCGYPSVRSVNSAFGGGGAYAPHISEGVNLAAENEFACLESTLVTNKTAIIHGVGLGAKDVDVIAKAKAKVIWSARTNVDLYGNTAPVTLLQTMGVTIGLGTDWLASGSMNMLRELACVDSMNQKYFKHAFDDRALFEMATKNSAIALGIDAQVGNLSVGKQADIAIFSATKDKEYRAVIGAGVEDVLLVLRGGKPLYGEATIVGGLKAGCDALPLCGAAKKVCLDVPGVTFADVQKQASQTYPLFFCKTETPKNEPSCVPYRDTYPSGTSATDADGDGVPDGSDNCPAIFNPARPLDGAAQADADGDGVGDACDLAPLDPAKH